MAEGPGIVSRLAAIAAQRLGLLVGPMLVAMCGFYLTTTLHHDVSWYLVATDRLLDGARLYVDIIEVNPPLAFYLAMPPVALARLAGIAPTACFIGYTFLLIAGSLLLIRRLLERQPGRSAGYRSTMLLAAATALAVAPIGVFGQREHLMLIFALPFLFLISARFAEQPCDHGFAALVGLFAAIGFCLKPHFFLVPAALELYLIIFRRSLFAVFRAECWSLFAGTILYAFFVVVAHPQYLDFIVPNAMLVYDVYASPLSSVLLQPPVFAILPAVILYAVLRSAGLVGRSVDAFTIAAIGFLAVFVVQSKGWPYQLLPASVATCLTATAVVVDVTTQRRTSQIARILLFVCGSSVLGIPLLLLVSGGAYSNPTAQRLLPAVEKYADNGTIYAFTSYVSVGFPLVNEAGVRWASRFPTQWLLPGTLRHLSHPEFLNPQSEYRLRQLEHYAADAVIEDLERAPPDLVIVDKSNGYFRDLKFDSLAYFGRYTRFAEFWQSYVKVEDVAFTIGGNKREYELWCRRNAARSCAG
jgi:hypothetical protein